MLVWGHEKFLKTGFPLNSKSPNMLPTQIFASGFLRINDILVVCIVVKTLRQTPESFYLHFSFSWFRISES